MKKLLEIRTRVYDIPEVKVYREKEGSVTALCPKNSTIPMTKS